MKGKKEDKILRDFFRQKLENAEIIPSPASSMKLMRQVGKKEFLRFNPSRFNIWYAGCIITAGTVLAIVLATNPGKQGKLSPANSTVKIGAPASTDNRNSIVVQPTVQNSGEKTQSALIQSDNASGKISRNINRKTEIKKIPADQGNISVPSSAMGPINEKGLFTNVASEKNNLLKQARISENQIEPSLTEGCAPLKVSFKNKIAKCDSCRWTFGDGGSSVEKNPKYLYDIPGEYKVTLIIFCPEGVQTTSSISIDVHTSPAARFDFTPENAVLPRDEIIFHNYSNDAASYRWDFGDGTKSELFEPRYTYKKQGHYNLKLVVYSEFGCSDSTIVQNAFSGSDYFIDFPNAFFPNINGPSNGYYSQKSDEGAQVFHPVFSGISVYQLRIFSRRGILIFETNDINIGWDGYLKGQLCESGVYIWKVRGNFMNGEPFTKMGDVTLLKN